MAVSHPSLAPQAGSQPDSLPGRGDFPQLPPQLWLNPPLSAFNPPQIPPLMAGPVQLWSRAALPARDGPASHDCRSALGASPSVFKTLFSGHPIHGWSSAESGQQVASS